MFKGLKRKISGFLAILMFTFGVFSGYPQPVEAAMESSVLYALEAILETVGLSMGYSYSSTSDLEQASRGLQYYGQNSAVDSSAWDSLYDLIFENHIPDSADMAAMQLNTAEIDFLRDYLGLQMALGVSSYSGSTSNEQIVYQNSLPDDFYTRFFSGCSVYVPDGCTLNASFHNYMNRGLIASKVVTPNVVTNDYGFTTYLYVPEDIPAFLVDNKDGTVQLYDANGQLVQFIYFQFDKKELSSSVVTSNYVQWSAGSTNYSIVPAYTGWAVHYTTYFDSLDLSEGYMMYSTFPVFSSVDQYAVYVESSQFYPVADRIVGSVDTVIGLNTGEDGLVTVPVTPSVTEQVQEAIEAATADGVTLTDEQLDQIAAAVIAGIRDDVVTGDETQTAGTIADIYVSVKAIQDIINSMSKTWTDGSSALQQDVEDIKENFTVMQGGGQDPDDPDNDDPKIWIPPGFFAVNFLAPLMEYFGDPLSEITKFLDRIMDATALLPQLFDEAGSLFLGNIFTSVSTIVSYCSDFVRILENLPKSIADVIEIPIISPQEIVEAFNEEFKIPEISFPEIVFPDLLSILTEFFTIDTAAINGEISSLQLSLGGHFPIFDQLGDIFSGLSFSSDYTYPVIKIGTPQILRPYYDEEYIILLDFGDYANYFKWARNIVTAMLWVGYSYSLMKHFKVNFHIG